ncbi:uncharacterized protein [Spinacia oleracea]|uniref:Transmembrane protein n=1 Tax=Spinacia oleracea TaxID=3562 RepID=A0ABM3QQK0_SPIOL|nr:uncharacterized protein LOC130461531 [Spinacia oleracea]
MMQQINKKINVLRRGSFNAAKLSPVPHTETRVLTPYFWSQLLLSFVSFVWLVSLHRNTNTFFFLHTTDPDLLSSPPNFAGKLKLHRRRGHSNSSPPPPFSIEAQD